MLATRIATALVLMAVLLPTLLVSSPWPFAILVLLAMSAAGWEWSRLNGAARAAPLLGVLLGLACGAALWAGWATDPPRALWWAALVAWVLGGASAIRRGVAGWGVLPRGPRIALGLVLLWIATLAFAHAKVIGIAFLLSVLMLVWAADVFAYFGGRALGRRKLAPAISPGKSWEGAWSGMAGALLVALAWWLLIDPRPWVDGPGFSGRVAAAHGWPIMLLAVVFVVAMSVVGDLFESLVKRSAGAKDSSRLLPGHGGVLDRIDALLPAMPIALALLSW